DLDRERHRRQAGAHAQPLRRRLHVVGHVRRPQVQTLVVDGDVDPVEFQLGDDPQGLLEGVLAKAGRGTCDEHGSLLTCGTPLPPCGGRRSAGVAPPALPRDGGTIASSAARGRPAGAAEIARPGITADARRHAVRVSAPLAIWRTAMPPSLPTSVLPPAWMQ